MNLIFCAQVNFRINLKLTVGSTLNVGKSEEIITFESKDPPMIMETTAGFNPKGTQIIGDCLC